MIYNKPINTIFVILCSFFLLTGFYAQNKHGHDFDTTNAQYLEIGVTEEEEVRELFGKPTSKTVAADGQEIWIYSYIFTSAAALDPFSGRSKVNQVHKQMTITMKKGVVQNYTVTDSTNSD